MFVFNQNVRTLPCVLSETSDSLQSVQTILLRELNKSTKISKDKKNFKYFLIFVNIFLFLTTKDNNSDVVHCTAERESLCMIEGNERQLRQLCSESS